MAQYLIQGDSLTNIASAIRAKTGEISKLTTSEMVSAINSIKTDRTIEIIDRTIKEYSDGDTTSIRDRAFAGCDLLTSISFPVCATIGSSAFAGCDLLTSISFPVCTTIGSTAFNGCSSLTSINFPACETIGNYVFDSCDLLTSINFHFINKYKFPCLYNYWFHCFCQLYFINKYKLSCL